MFWYGEYSEMKAQSSGLSGSPYSATQDAPASSRWYRFMSSSGTLAHQRTEQFRVLGQHDAHQEAAVAATLRGQLVDRRDPAGHQIGCYRGEVLGHQMSALTHGLGVPGGPYSPPPRCWPVRRCRPGSATACRGRLRNRGCSTPRNRRSRRAVSCQGPSNREGETTKYGIMVPSVEATKCCPHLDARRRRRRTARS